MASPTPQEVAEGILRKHRAPERKVQELARELVQALAPAPEPVPPTAHVKHPDCSSYRICCNQTEGLPPCDGCDDYTPFTPYLPYGR